MMKELKFCRICLCTNSSGEFNNMEEWNLVSAYEILTGNKINKTIPQLLCPYCCSLLRKYVEFKRKCINTRNLLHRVLITYKGQISTEILDTTRRKYKLGLPYTITQRCTVNTEPCDELGRKLDSPLCEESDEKPLAKNSTGKFKLDKCEELGNDVKNKNEGNSVMKCKENNVIKYGRNPKVVFNVSLLPPEKSNEPKREENNIMQCEENCNKIDYKYIEYENVFEEISKYCSKEKCECIEKYDEPGRIISEINYMDILKYITLSRIEQIHEDLASSEPEKLACQPQNIETLNAETDHVTFYNAQDDDEDIDDFMICQNQVLVHSLESSGERGTAAQAGAGIKDRVTKHTQTIIANVFCHSVSPLLPPEVETTTLNQKTSISMLYTNTLAPLPASLDAINETAASNQKTNPNEYQTTCRNIFKRKFSRKYDFMKSHVVKKTTNGKYLIKITIRNIEKNDKMSIQYVAQHYSDELLNAVEELVEKIVQKLKA